MRQLGGASAAKPHGAGDVGMERCAGCGLEVEGGMAGCQRIFDQLVRLGQVARRPPHRPLLIDRTRWQSSGRQRAAAALPGHHRSREAGAAQGARSSHGGRRSWSRRSRRALPSRRCLGALHLGRLRRSPLDRPPMDRPGLGGPRLAMAPGHALTNHEDLLRETRCAPLHPARVGMTCRPPRGSDTPQVETAGSAPDRGSPIPNRLGSSGGARPRGTRRAVRGAIRT